jgi:hypothetical protein
MADIEARVNENSPIGFFTWCWIIVVEITDGRIGSIVEIVISTRRDVSDLALVQSATCGSYLS